MVRHRACWAARCRLSTSDAAPTTGVGNYTGVITASGLTSTNYTISYVAWQSDCHAGAAVDHGEWCVASLRCFRSYAGSDLLGIREW